MYSIAQAQPAGLIDRIAGLVGPLVYLKALPTELKHFGHER
jgi:hypothetical protein